MTKRLRPQEPMLIEQVTRVLPDCDGIEIDEFRVTIGTCVGQHWNLHRATELARQQANVQAFTHRRSAAWSRPSRVEVREAKSPAPALSGMAAMMAWAARAGKMPPMPQRPHELGRRRVR